MRKDTGCGSLADQSTSLVLWKQSFYHVLKLPPWKGEYWVLASSRSTLLETEPPASSDHHRVLNFPLRDLGGPLFFTDQKRWNACVWAGTFSWFRQLFATLFSKFTLFYSQENRLWSWLRRVLFTVPRTPFLHVKPYSIYFEISSCWEGLLF